MLRYSKEIFVAIKCVPLFLFVLNNIIIKGLKHYLAPNNFYLIKSICFALECIYDATLSIRNQFKIIPSSAQLFAAIEM